MSLVSLLHPFARIRRPGYLAVLTACLCAAGIGLYGLRFGGAYSFLALVLFVAALWLLFSAMVNRTRDADASAGWVLFPVIVTGVAAFTVAKLGYVDFSNFILSNETRADRIVSAPFRPFIMIASAFIPMLLALAISTFFWLVSLLALAVLPSRGERG